MATLPTLFSQLSSADRFGAQIPIRRCLRLSILQPQSEHSLSLPYSSLKHLLPCPSALRVVRLATGIVGPFEGVVLALIADNEMSELSG